MTAAYSTVEFPSSLPSWVWLDVPHGNYLVWAGQSFSSNGAESGAISCGLYGGTAEAGLAAIAGAGQGSPSGTYGLVQLTGVTQSTSTILLQCIRQSGQAGGIAAWINAVPVDEVHLTIDPRVLGTPIPMPSPRP